MQKPISPMIAQIKHKSPVWLIHKYCQWCRCIQRRDFTRLFWQQVGLMLYMWDTNCSTDHTIPAPLNCTNGNANSGGRYSICVSDVRGALTGNIRCCTEHWGHVNLRADEIGSLFSNNNIFTILSLKPTIAIEYISVAAFNEALRQFLYPIYAHT